MVGSDLANIVNEAALLAARKNKSAVEMDDFEEAIDRVVAGLEKRNRVMNPREKEIVAYHETGHALVAEALPTTDKVHRVSIIPRGIGALGYTMQLPTEDRYLMTKSELEDRMAVMMGGRVAEELVFQEISTGAQNDLYRATDIARSMVREYGMSEKLGPMTFERERRAHVSGRHHAAGHQRLQRSHGPGDRPGGGGPGEPGPPAGQGGPGGAAGHPGEGGQDSPGKRGPGGRGTAGDFEFYGAAGKGLKYLPQKGGSSMYPHNNRPLISKSSDHAWHSAP